MSYIFPSTLSTNLVTYFSFYIDGHKPYHLNDAPKEIMGEHHVVTNVIFFTLPFY